MSDKSHLIHIDPAGVVTEHRERLLNQRPFVRHVRSAITWFGIGALVHAWFLGPHFDARSLWSWGYLLAWPIPMLVWLAIQVAIIGLWLLLAIAAVAVTYWAAKASAEYVRGRRQ